MPREDWFVVAGLFLITATFVALLWGPEIFESIAWWVLFRDRGPGL